MKHLILLFCALVGLASGLRAQHANQSKMKARTIVVYFSATGTTKAAAEKIARATDAKLVAIEPVKPYTPADLNWHDDNSRSSLEMNDPKARPACKPIDLAGYDIVYLGYPIWWNEAPRVINSFLETHDLTHKRVIPFATSGSSSISNSTRMLKKAYPSIQWEEGRRLNQASQAEIEKWVK